MSEGDASAADVGFNELALMWRADVGLVMSDLLMSEIVMSSGQSSTSTILILIAA